MNKENIVATLKERAVHNEDFKNKIRILDSYGFSYSELLYVAADFYNQKVELEKQLEATQQKLKAQKLGKEKAKLNGWEKQAMKVKAGKKKPAYRSDITPELVVSCLKVFGSQKAVADQLGISVKTVRSRLREAGIE